MEMDEALAFESTSSHQIRRSRPVNMFFRLAVLLLPWSVSAFPGTLLSRDAEINTSYDYVIVGGGTSGLVVAN